MTVGRPPRSSRAEVVDVGLQLLKSEGLAAVTLSAIGDRLGLHKVALYTYVKSKEDLLLAMRDEVYQRQLAVLRDQEPLPPEAGLKAMCLHLHDLMTDYGPLMTALEPDLSGPALEVGERFLDLLARAGLGPREQLQVYVLLTSLLTSAVGRPPASATRSVADVELGQFPRLSALFGDGVPALTSLTEDALALILDVLVPALRRSRR